MDMKRQAEIRVILAANGIDYYVKTKNLLSGGMSGSSRNRTGSLGINWDYAYEYKIYVRKQDYERASHLIR